MLIGALIADIKGETRPTMLEVSTFIEDIKEILHADDISCIQRSADGLHFIFDRDGAINCKALNLAIMTAVPQKETIVAGEVVIVMLESIIKVREYNAGRPPI